VSSANDAFSTAVGIVADHRSAVWLCCAYAFGYAVHFSMHTFSHNNGKARCM